MWKFVIIWFGQLVSLIGTNLTGFALGVWVFQRTGSVTQFAFITVCTMLPGILISPLAGVLVDRWDRRAAMMLSDSGAGLCSFAIVLLLLGHHLAIWHLYLALSLSSIFNAFQRPAYLAATTLLVPKQHLGRASGMIQFGDAFPQVCAPIMAGALLSLIHLWGVILIDFATFFFALLTQVFVRFPHLPPANPGQAGRSSVFQEAAESWRYMTVHPGLLGLLLFIAVTNFTLGFVVILIQPLVLGLTSPVVLGTILSFGGVGMVLGSVGMSIWGGPQPLVNGVLVGSLVQGLLLFLGGLQPSLLLIAAAVFVFMFSNPFIFGCDQVIWQKKVAPAMQGRIFAFRNMVTMGSLAAAFLAAGPLADYVFEPLLAVGGPLSGSVGLIIGVGPGRGIGFLFIVTGVLTVLATVAGYLYPRLRFVEQELPDVISEPTLQG